jgi:L-ribulose-5-phosphate 3-epimerase
LTVTSIGIMQGRLVPPIDDRIQCFPRDEWASEFPLAAAAGLHCIEWIFDEFGKDVNPLASDDGIDAVLALADEHGVRVASVCADYFMDHPLVRAAPEELARRATALAWLLGRCARLGATRVVVPFVDDSRIDTADELDAAVESLHRALPVAERTGVELHVESSLEPECLAELLERLPHPLLKVNYDSGNSSSLGYLPRAEFSAYGPRIGSVHVKDRLLRGSTVPLGSGDADLPSLFDCLAKVDYAGDIVLQVARGVPGDEVAWAGHNRDVVAAYMAAAGWPPSET